MNLSTCFFYLSNFSVCFLYPIKKLINCYWVIMISSTHRELCLCAHIALVCLFHQKQKFVVRIDFKEDFNQWNTDLPDCFMSILVLFSTSVWINVFRMSHVATSLLSFASIIEVIFVDSVITVRLETCSRSIHWYCGLPFINPSFYVRMIRDFSTSFL